MLRQVTRARRRELEDVDEDALVGVAGVEGQHPVVHVLLGALGLIAGCKKSTSGVRVEAGLKPSGLRILLDAVDDGPPLTVHVPGALRGGVDDLRWAEVALRSDPVGGIIWGRPLGSTSIGRVVKHVLLPDEMNG